MNELFAFKEEELASTRSTKAWMTDPRYFKDVHVSSAAAMKMLQHAVSGVEKGMKKDGIPVEVMGLVIGRPSLGTDANLDSIVITDAFPLPIEGAHTRVLADDAEVINYMIRLSDSLGKVSLGVTY